MNFQDSFHLQLKINFKEGNFKLKFIITALLSLTLFNQAQALTFAGSYDQTSEGDYANQFINAIEAAGAKESTDASGSIKIELTNLKCPTVYELRTIPGLKGCTFTQSVDVTVGLEPSVTILNNFQISQVHATETVGDFAHFSFNKVSCTKSNQSICTFTFEQAKN